MLFIRITLKYDNQKFFFSFGRQPRDRFFEPWQHGPRMLGQHHVGPELAPVQRAKSKSGNGRVSPSGLFEVGRASVLPSWAPICLTFAFGRRQCVIRGAEPKLQVRLAPLNTSGKTKLCPVGPQSELLAGIAQPKQGRHRNIVLKLLPQNVRQRLNEARRDLSAHRV